MEKTENHNPTLAVYGIQDTDDGSYPDYVHDHNITLFNGGRIIRHGALERITRVKYDSSMPAHLYNLLKQEDLLGRFDLDLVFVDNPVGRAFINQKGNIRFEAPLNNELAAGPEEGKAWLLERPVKAWVVNHELAHVFSNMPFFGPFKENSLHVHFDGGASKSNFSAWLWRNGAFSLIEGHWDLKHLSSLFNANALTFAIVGAGKKDQNSMPGKFMGYSSFGRYSRKLEDWLWENDFFSDMWGSKQPFFRQVKKDWKTDLKSFNLENPFLQDIAATIQHIFERELLRKLRELKNHTHAGYLYYSGGSALNIKANTALLESGMFRKVYIPPCTNDSGLSIGAGACLEWHKHGRVGLHSPYLNNWGLKDQTVRYTQKDLYAVAEILVYGRVVAVCNGYGETGPRALGNRSLLARADDPELAHWISMDLKGREWYRPVAPVMLARNLSRLMPSIRDDELSHYMLRDYQIPYLLSDPIQGALHVDGTARIQTLGRREDNPYLYDLLDLLEKEYQVFALINTSFNAPGRPIVHTQEDAFREAREMGIRHLVVNGRHRRL